MTHDSPPAHPPPCRTTRSACRGSCPAWGWGSHTLYTQTWSLAWTHPGPGHNITHHHHDQDAADLLGEAGRHPGLEAGLPVQVGRHHVALALGVAGVEHDGVTGHLLVLPQVQHVTDLHLLAPDLGEPLLPDHCHYPLVCPLVLFVPDKQKRL